LIDWNIYTIINTLFVTVNIIPLSIVAFKVYKRDPESRINRLFSLGVVFQIIGFMLFPLGGLLWTVEIIGIRLIFITQRLVLFFAFTSQLVICWCSRVLYDGEALWNRSRNIIFIGGFLLVIAFGLLSPNAIYIIEGPPEIDTGEGIWLGMCLYSVLPTLLVFSFLTFWKTYVEFHNDDSIIGRQALMLATGSIFNILAVLSMLFSLLLLAHSLMSLVYIFTTIAMAIMSFGFTRDSSLLKLKITSELRRLGKVLLKGQLSEAEIQLMHIKHLVTSEASKALEIRMLILEAKVHIYQTKLDSARDILVKARSFAESSNHLEFTTEIEKHLEHVGVHERATAISDSVHMHRQQRTDSENLEDVMKYLDEIIAIRSGKENSH
ncbi:MAG: hypothetical protein ACTSUO_09730, partial [Candidatus Thorarchaeota archaeon]